mmetsp:Transcript_43007/g.80005  ORF Transcript_43007/g.80005 Transcript_43007/m.80005 type:complete len:277 (+) Transcript_43007:108-938(+)
MFFDLGVTWDAKRAPIIAELALRFGYAGIAHTVTVNAAQLADLRAHRCAIAPKRLPSEALRNCGPLRDLATALGLDTDQGDFIQLRRLTVRAADEAQVAVVSEAARQRLPYDLIAVRPTTEEAFQHSCESCECDLISLSLDEKLHFPLRRQHVMAFMKRGGLFEVEFAPALRDPTRRRNLFVNMEQLLKPTRGKNVILSSGASDRMEMRSPHDLANFAAVLGLRGPLALQSVADVPYRALQRGVLRRGCAQPVPRPLASTATVPDDEDMISLKTYE